MKNVHRYSEIIIIFLILIICLKFAAIMGVHRYGDGSNYYLMATSLARDGDLAVDNKDIARWNKYRFEDVPAGAYIIIDKQGIMHYGKPILYPLLAAPFYILFGNFGFNVLNGIFLGACIAFGYLFLRRFLSKFGSLLFVTLFYLCSFMPAYVSWIHPEMMLFFFCALCMWLWLAKDRIILAALIIGIVTSVRPIFILLLLPMILELISKKKYKESKVAVVTCFLGLIIISIITGAFLKQIYPYTGLRGYLPAGKMSFGVEDLKNHLLFLNFRGQQLSGIEYNSLKLLFINLVNFFVGRFTGLIWYLFPGMICIGIYITLRKRMAKEEKIRGDGIILAALSLILILIIFRPLNYFGGGDFICNRYFFIAPALLFLPTVGIFKKRYFFVLLFIPGFLISSQMHLNAPGQKNIKNHARTFPLKYAPFEIAQVEAIIGKHFQLSNNISLYAPLGIEALGENNFLLNKKQEIVLVTKGNLDSFKIQTDQQELNLNPAIKLKCLRGNEFITFFYHKAKQQLSLKVNK